MTAALAPVLESSAAPDAASTPLSIPAIRWRIEQALLRRAALDARQIHIELSDGQVILNGDLGSWSARAEVDEAVLAQPGVTAVDDRLGIYL